MRKVDVRLIVATNQVLDDKVKRGEFREDLYYRINVIPISIPTLRERKEDIPYLVEHFIAKYRKKNGYAAKSISKRASSILINYDWPGNVRELENIIERAIALNPANEIMPEFLPDEIWNRKTYFEPEPNPKQTKLAEVQKMAILETLERMEGNKKRTG